jgi:N-acetylglucosaminyltransferase
MTAMLGVLVHSLVAVVFANRYFAGLLSRLLRGSKFDEKIEGYEPRVTVVIPMFNEGEGIRRTIASLLDQTYPAEKLEIVVVDDCSTDGSYKHALAAAQGSSRVTVVRNRVNMGKRRGIIGAVRRATSEIIVSVDSDVVVGPTAVAELVKRFVSPDIAAVGGRVDIRNKHDNWLTRMQAVKYYYGYIFLKNLERAFRNVMCLSGCLTAYRRSVLMELEPILADRCLVGVPIKYGEDRFLTRQIVKAGYKTVMTLDAICWTIAPATLNGYFSQQLRWRRSNIIDYAGGLSHVWRLHPIVALHFFSLFGLILAYPALIFHSLASGTFWGLMTLHLGVVALFGVIYRVMVRDLPAEERVSALSFLPIAIVMPVTYALLTPLALFTLDSGTWETRGHVDAEAEVLRASDVPLVTGLAAQEVRSLNRPAERPLPRPGVRAA